MSPSGLGWHVDQAASCRPRRRPRGRRRATARGPVRPPPGRARSRGHASKSASRRSDGRSRRLELAVECPVAAWELRRRVGGRSRDRSGHRSWLDRGRDRGAPQRRSWRARPPKGPRPHAQNASSLASICGDEIPPSRRRGTPSSERVVPPATASQNTIAGKRGRSRGRLVTKRSVLSRAKLRLSSLPKAARVYAPSNGESGWAATIAKDPAWASACDRRCVLELLAIGRSLCPDHPDSCRRGHPDDRRCSAARRAEWNDRRPARTLRRSA